MRDLDDLFSALARSKFRSRFRLRPAEREYLAAKTLPVIVQHAEKFIRQRLAPAEPRNDGRQTPMRGHPVFVAQHATATCCRSCLSKWHRIPAGRELSDGEVGYVVDIIRHWLLRQGSPTT